MKEYHKIHSVFKRDPETKNKTLLMGQYSMPEFEYLEDNEWIFTEKVDGTNIRVMIDETGKIAFGGKTDNAEMPSALGARLREKFTPLADMLHEIFPNGACLYGEGYGPKIQSSGKYRDDQDFVLFDIKIGHFWLERKNIEEIAKKFDIEIVPIIGYGILYKMIKMAENGIISTWGDFEAEGIVARPSCELKTRHGERIITKIKTSDFHD